MGKVMLMILVEKLDGEVVPTEEIRKSHKPVILSKEKFSMGWHLIQRINNQYKRMKINITILGFLNNLDSIILD